MCGVFRVLRVVSHSKRKVVDPGLMTLNQFLKSGPIAFLHQLNKFIISLFTSGIDKRIEVSCHTSLDTGGIHL